MALTNEEQTRLMMERTLCLNIHEFGTVLAALYSFVHFQLGDANKVKLDVLNDLITVRGTMKGMTPEEVIELIVTMVEGERVPEIDESIKSDVYVPEASVVERMF